MDWLSPSFLTLIGVFIAALGILATYLITSKISHRPKLNISVTVATRLSSRDIGPNFQMQMDAHAIHNLIVYNVEVSLRGRRDIGNHACQKAPYLYFLGSRIYRVHTVNNDESKFRIPIGLKIIGHDANIAYLNIERMRARTIAKFQLIGTEIKPDDNIARVEFFPGAILDVDVTTSGIIEQPWKKTG